MRRNKAEHRTSKDIHKVSLIRHPKNKKLLQLSYEIPNALSIEKELL